MEVLLSTVRLRAPLLVGPLLLLLAPGGARAAAPTLTLSATPTIVPPGAAVTLTWAATDVTACAASGGWAGPRPSAGTEPANPSVSTTYALACTGAQGTVTKAVTVTVKGDECEQLATCVIEGAATVCQHPFTAPSQGVVRVTVKPLAPGLVVEWRVTTAAGAPAASCGTPRSTTSADCGPLPAGDYRLEITPGGAGGTGSVAVDIQGLTACESTRVDCDQAVTDEISPAVDSELFRFSAADGEVVRITPRTLTGALVPEWRLLTTAGAPAGVCDAFQRGPADCGPLAAGSYEIQVRDELRQNTGVFTLHLQRLTAAAACDSTPVFCDRTTTGDVDPGVDSDLYRFTVLDAEVVRVTIDAMGGTVVPEWRLLTAGGLAAPACGSFGTKRASDCGPLPAGDYQVQVKDSTAQQTGAYAVTVTFLTRPCPNCGNGIVSGDEECDPPGGCCTSTCHFAAAGFACRPAAGDCDVVETCSGASAACPTDVVKGEGVICRTPVGICDLAERCSGRRATCPADALAPAGTVCRPAAGECDLAETCTGAGGECPALDQKRTTVCRPPVGPCDAAEACDGVSDVCPPDRLAPAGTVCRPVAHACDAAETCSGTSLDCPPNLLPPGVCGDGCVGAGEECGESGLGPCAAGSACVDCRCLACATRILDCPTPPAPDGGFEVTVDVDVGSRALGAYALALAWDATILRLEAVRGGATPEFAAPPACDIDQTAGTATCGASQASRSDGPSGRVDLAHVRLTALGSTAGRPTLTLTFTSLADPQAAALTVCPEGGTCAVPACATAGDCDDGNECTADACQDGGCVASGAAGFDGAACELRRLPGALACADGPIDARLARFVARNAGRARRALERAKTAKSGKRARLLRRADRWLQAVQQRAVRDRRLSVECSASIDRALGERRQQVSGLAS